jgi:hypothetical protein
MVGLLAGDDRVLRRAGFLAKALCALQLLNYLLGEEQLFLQELGGGLGRNTRLLLRLLLLGLLVCLLHLLLLKVELLLLLGLSLAVGLLLLLHLLGLLGAHILPLVNLTLTLVLLLLVACWSSCVQAWLVLRLLSALRALIRLLQEAVSARRGVSSLALLHVCELLADHLGVHCRRELLCARVRVLTSHTQ